MLTEYIFVKELSITENLVLTLKNYKKLIETEKALALRKTMDNY